jgi:signal transduction histidine kinase
MPAKRPKEPRSLRSQVALVVALLAFLPNAALVMILFSSLWRDGQAFTAPLWLSLLAWLLALVAFSGSMGYLMSRQLLAPLTRLTEQIEALQRSTRNPRSGLPLVLTDPAEIAAFKQSFNQLLAQVNQEQARRTSFMATLMHDLKTPLIAASHLLTAIRDNDQLSRDERVMLVGQLLEENRRLTELVQKMVDAHKYERDGVTLTKAPCDLGPLVQTLAERARPLAAERGVTIEVRGSASAVVDARELERALANLLTNALRYARSRVTLELFAGVIRLADDGPGLPAPLEQLAQPFNAQPVQIAGQRYTAGTGGLGLYIARRIIEAHGGRLVTEASSERGTVLLIYLGTAGG